MAVGDYSHYYKNVAGVYQYFQPAGTNVFMILSFGGSHNTNIGLHDSALGVDDSCMGTGVFNGLMSTGNVEPSVANTKIIINNSVYLNSYTTIGLALVHACMIQVQ